MGGRGSGGGRSGGGGGTAKSELSKFTNRDIDLIDVNSPKFKDAWIKEYSQMNDSDLNKAYKNSRQALNKANKNLKSERSKLKSIVDNFRNVKETDSDFKTKTDAMNKQMANVDRALNRVKVKETVHYLAVNEKFNVRGKKK